MPRSVSIHPDRKQTVENALKRNGFLTQGDLAAHLDGMALSTVSLFLMQKMFLFPLLRKFVRRWI